MPIYVYRCDNCSHEHEESRPLGDHRTDCPECGRGALRVIPQPFTHRWELPWRMRGNTDVTDGHDEQITERDAVGYTAEEV